MKYCLSHPKNKYLEKTDEISIVLPADIAQLDLKKMIDSSCSSEMEEMIIKQNFLSLDFSM